MSEDARYTGTEDEWTEDERRGVAPADETTEAGGDRAGAGDRYHDEGGYDEANGGEEAGDSHWSEGVVGVLLVAGLVLLLFPEPATSGLGALLIALGVLAWLVDAVR